MGDILHLATHGVWDATDSHNNYLKLSRGQKLAQKDIFALDLSGTSMVTLSACNTATGDSQELGWVPSLAEAFWFAGSRSVVASLWSVEDRSTELLMGEFYKALKSGYSRAEALQRAHKAVHENPQYQHPFYWAGFLLFGDYR
jgi:CHAT domain-containing protein